MFFSLRELTLQLECFGLFFLHVSACARKFVALKHQLFANCLDHVGSLFSARTPMVRCLVANFERQRLTTWKSLIG